MYDWANSMYTSIMAAIFPIDAAWPDNRRKGDQLLNYGIGATGVVADGPYPGSRGRLQGHEEKLFTAFWLLGVVYTALITDQRLPRDAGGCVLSRISTGSTLFDGF